MLDAESYYSMKRPRFFRGLFKWLLILGIIGGAINVVKFYF